MALQSLWSLQLQVDQVAEYLDAANQVVARVTLARQESQGSSTRDLYRVNDDPDSELCAHRDAVKWRLRHVIPGAQPSEDLPARRRWRLKS